MKYPSRRQQEQEGRGNIWPSNAVSPTSLGFFITPNSSPHVKHSVNGLCSDDPPTREAAPRPCPGHTTSAAGSLRVAWGIGACPEGPGKCLLALQSNFHSVHTTEGDFLAAQKDYPDGLEQVILRHTLFRLQALDNFACFYYTLLV